MGVVAQLSSSDIAVEPGRQVTFGMQVRNTGSVVDRFTFEALGTAAGAIRFSPETLSLFPEATGTVNVTVELPREPGSTAGPNHLGIKVISSEDPESTVVEEATLNVSAFSNVGLELVPKVVPARRWGRTKLVVDNRSNCPFRGAVEGYDSRGALDIAFRPAVLDVAPGEAVFVSTSLRPKAIFWRGPDKTLPFSVSVQSSTGETSDAAAAPVLPHPPAVTTDGSLVQQPMLPGWLLKALAVLVALAVLLVILWFALFKPQLRSTAKDEVNKQLAATGLITSSKPSSGSSGGSGKSSSGGSKSSPGTAPASPPVVISNGGSVNSSAAAAGNGSQVVYTVPVGQSLNITDLLVENPAGDTGTIALARNGTLLMQWSLANFRDLDYHWITPTVFGPGTQVQMVVSGCPNACTPGMYVAGNLVKA
jgi:hypothetical protein